MSLEWFKNRYSSNRVSFQQKTRNIFCVVMFFVWLFLSIDLLVSVIIQEYSLHLLLRKSGAIFISILLPLGLIKAHKESAISDFTISYFIQICSVANTFSSLLVAPTRPIDLNAILLGVSVATMNVPHWKLQLVTSIPGLFIMTYNSALGMRGYPMLSIITPEENVIAEIIIYSRVVICFWLLILMIREQSCGSYRLECSIGMTKEVSEHIAEYDTKSAEATLLEYKKKDNCDKELCETLTVIVENLKKYRTHLPNYVVSPMEEDGMTTPVTTAPQNQDSLNSIEVNTIDDDDSDNSEVNKESTSSSNPVAAPPEKDVSPPSPLRSSFVDLSSSEGYPSSVRRITSLRLLATVPVRREVSYALIDFRHKNDDVIDNPVPLREFIDRVYQAANRTQAAVHSCVGDIIHMTWNAASRVRTPRQNAVTYIHTMKPKPSQQLSNRVDWCCSVMSGICECRMTGTIHHTFLLNTGWGEVHHEMLKYARTVQTNVVCGDTAKGTRHHAALMLVDIIHSIEVYEMTTAKNAQLFGPTMRMCLTEQMNVELALKKLEDVVSLQSEDNVPGSVHHLRQRLIT
eukprot:PhF_6_TR37924/c0_g1_i1/m.56671